MTDQTTTTVDIDALPPAMIADLNAAHFVVEQGHISAVDGPIATYRVDPADTSWDETDEARWAAADRIMRPYGYKTGDGEIIDGWSHATIEPAMTTVTEDDCAEVGEELQKAMRRVDVAAEAYRTAVEQENSIGSDAALELARIVAALRTNCALALFHRTTRHAGALAVHDAVLAHCVGRPRTPGDPAETANRALNVAYQKAHATFETAAAAAFARAAEAAADHFAGQYR